MSLRLLVGLDLLRVRRAFTHPRLVFWGGAALPALLLAGGIWVGGDSVRPDPRDGDARFLLGVLVAAPLAMQAYPALFRSADDPLHRRLGLTPSALFAHRALRLLLLGVGIVALLALPLLRGGEREGIAMLARAALVGWAASLYFAARGADLTATPGRRRGPLTALIGWDPELARNAPLVYAPILPVVLTAFAARLTLGAGPVGLGVLLAGTAGLVVGARRRFARALPRFAPHAQEIAWAPQSLPAAGEIAVRRGLPGVLPRRAALVMARDGLVASRGQRAASRAAPWGAVLGALLLLRAGDSPEARRWVALVCAAAIVTGLVPLVALGRAERARTRWIDRSLGLSPADRVAGRAAQAAGRALALAAPVAIAWTLAAPSAAWPWLAGALAASLVAAGASLLAAGR